VGGWFGVLGFFVRHSHLGCSCLPFAPPYLDAYVKRRNINVLCKVAQQAKYGTAPLQAFNTQRPAPGLSVLGWICEPHTCRVILKSRSHLLRGEPRHFLPHQWPIGVGEDIWTHNSVGSFELFHSRCIY